MKGPFNVVIHNINATKSMDMCINKTWRNAIARIIQYFCTFWQVFYMLSKFAIHKFQITSTTDSVWIIKLICFNICRHKNVLSIVETKVSFFFIHIITLSVLFVNGIDLFLKKNLKNRVSQLLTLFIIH